MSLSPLRVPERDRAAAELLARTARQLFGMGRADLAHPLARTALETDNTFANAHSVMAGILDTFGAFGGALYHWREAARLMPNASKQQLNLALALLGDGQWEAGLPMYEARLMDTGWSSLAVRGGLAAVRDRLARPDTPLSGRRVLVVSEQGIGDAIWSARFLAQLATRCATVTLATGADLKPLLARVDGPADIISPPEGQRDARINLLAPAAAHDHVIPMMSLPWVLGVRPGADFDGIMPYLAADPEQITAWRSRYREMLPGAQRIIGLIWRANPIGPASDSRSIPVSAFAPFGTIADVGFVNLQGGAEGIRSAIEPILPGIVDALRESAGHPPLDQFAAAVAATDLVVSVDTMGAHLAGAMAHPGIVLLPTAPSFGFVWGHRGNRSPWYPSLRLIRQHRHRDWDGPVMTARALLASPHRP